MRTDAPPRSSTTTEEAADTTAMLGHTTTHSRRGRRHWSRTSRTTDRTRGAGGDEEGGGGLRLAHHRLDAYRETGGRVPAEIRDGLRRVVSLLALFAVLAVMNLALVIMAWGVVVVWKWVFH
jgi:hypothetical protein